MKKICILIVILLAAHLAFADTQPPTPDAIQPLTGYIYSNVSFSVALLEEVFPFDLTNTLLAEDTATPSAVNGLRIGTYSLQSTGTTFKLYVTHDRLTVVERTFGTDDGTISNIDYRLYMQLGNLTNFKYCASATTPEATISNGAVTTNFDNCILFSGSTIDLINQSIYVCLYDHAGGNTTAATVNKLMGGTYSSNIYFYLEV